MIVRGASRTQIEQAFLHVNTLHSTSMNPGLSAYGNTGIRPVGRGFTFTLKLESSRDPFHRHGQFQVNRDRSYQANGCGRSMTYVCWHGHREFMRAIYALAPDAVIKTGLTTYKNSAHFENTHRDTNRNIGSEYRPVYFSEACDCERQVCPRNGRIAWNIAPSETTTFDPESVTDNYGQDEADGAACRAMANALRSLRQEVNGGK